MAAGNIKPSPGIPAVGFSPDFLYQLTYMQGYALRTTLLDFKREYPINQVVEKAKVFCGNRNWRFMHVEKAVHTMNGNGET